MVNFLFSNSNMYTSKISMAKAILDFFIETKDAKHYSNYIKQKLTTENVAPSKTHIMW